MGEPVLHELQPEVSAVTPDAIAWFDAMPDAVLIVDAQHRVLFASQAISRLFGYDRDWLIGRSMEILLPIGLRATHAHLVAEFARGGATVRAHEAALLTGRHANGDTFAVDVTISRRSNADGVMMVAVIRDATRRVAQAKALEDKSEQFRLIAEASHDALYSWDPTNGTKWLGDGVSRFLGYDPSEAMDVAWWESRIHPDDRERVLRSIDQYMRSNALTWSMEYRFKRADQSDAVVLNRSIATRDADGTVVMAMGALMDVTELREAQAQMVHANKMEAIGRLAGGVAHDFNNLLSVILSSAELLLDGFGHDDPRFADASEIRHAAIRASHVTRQLLALSRRDESKPQVLSVEGALADIRRLLQRLLGGSIDVVVRAPVPDAYVRIDPIKFEQVLINLAVNARDAMPDGGELLIELRVERAADVATGLHAGMSTSEWVHITIHDSGCGMPDAVLAHVFEPFFTTKSASDGTGLGLSICDAIVRDAGGSISVASEVGVGTTFTVRLPLTTARPSRAPVAARVSARTGQERILLVEDEPTLLASYAHALQRAGYRVTSALTADGAFDALGGRVHTFDLLICDLRLPRMHGTVLTQTLRRTHLIPRVLFISGYDDDLLAVADAGLPGATTARKPLAGDELLERVRSALDQPITPVRATRTGR